MVYLVYSETGLRLFNTQKIGGGVVIFLIHTTPNRKKVIYRSD